MTAATTHMGNILICDSDDHVYDLISNNLEISGYDVTRVLTAREVLGQDLSHVDLIVIDATDLQYSGFMLTEEIKSDPFTAHIPIIMCSSRDSQDDILKGFDAGVDDYITKPFSIRELLARIKAMLRRHSRNFPSEQNRLYSHRGITLDPATRRVVNTDTDEEIPLTRKEYEILLLLLKNKNVYFTRQDIIHVVWNDNSDVNDRTIDVNIYRLRKKLGRLSEMLVNRSGYGYAILEN
jgi:DNA-binding response OmpR family regulator